MRGRGETRLGGEMMISFTTEMFRVLGSRVKSLIEETWENMFIN